ncbi:hypothetical protein [Porphyrobacter sp. LM 6]|uniref:hypothetical protein n=1 Tax=Porphyrobacter sp. LM 6 TaxID=1896196 RepID=UPI000863BEAA|nr:hypothetical protein [Porphyrobacter sp. LM 6]AOL94628.1 hypothetical protein BG023_111702 [Porphyrobacter sp. LM 6]
MKITAMGKALAAAGALGLGVVLAPVAAQAQDSAAAKPAEEVTWARVVMTRFHVGKRDRGIEIIKDYFAKADAMAGTGSGIHGIHLDTGAWDMIYVFPMKGGPGEMAERNSPEGAKWMEQMVKLAGSKEAAEKIIAEFDTLVAQQITEVGHAHSDH